MTLSNVDDLLKQSMDMPANDQFEIDLSEVTAVDTATISLILEWIRRAKEQDTAIRFLNFPHNLISLANVYGVLDLIPQAGH